MSRESATDFKDITAFLKDELAGEKVEVYASLDSAAYQTASRLMQHELRDSVQIIADNQLEGISPYGKSCIAYQPFPLFELTHSRHDHAIEAVNLFKGGGQYVHIESSGFDFEHLVQAITKHFQNRNILQLNAIVSRTKSHVLMVTNTGVIERIPEAWGLQRIRGEIPYLSGVIITPEERNYRKFQPVTKYAITETITI